MARHKIYAGVLLFSAFTIIYTLPCAHGLVLKTDEATKEVVLAEEDAPNKTTDTPGEEKDHISTDRVPDDPRFKEYVATVNEAVIYIQRGKYEKAVKKLKEAVVMEPRMPYAYDNLANAYYHLHKYEEAIEMSKAALNIAPGYANAYGNLGNIYYALKKYPEAKANYQKAKELFQKSGNLEGLSKTEESLAQPSL